MNKKTYRRVLTIAGSDPSGGAGPASRPKTFAACGCYGASAVVAVVDENTVGVTGVHPIPVDFVTGQIRSVLDDIGADAIKIGMLHSSELIRRRTPHPRPISDKNIVLDPVMVATSGYPLLEADAVATLRDELIPHVRVITPNIPEAELLPRRKDKIAGIAARRRQKALGTMRRNLSTAQGRTSPRRRANRRVLQRRKRAAHHAQIAPQQHRQHPRHRLHAVVGIRRLPRPRPRSRPRGHTRQKTTSQPPSKPEPTTP